MSSLTNNKKCFQAFFPQRPQRKNLFSLKFRGVMPPTPFYALGFGMDSLVNLPNFRWHHRLNDWLKMTRKLVPGIKKKLMETRNNCFMHRLFRLPKILFTSNIIQALFWTTMALQLHPSFKMEENETRTLIFWLMTIHLFICIKSLWLPNWFYYYKSKVISSNVGNCDDTHFFY